MDRHPRRRRSRRRRHRLRTALRGHRTEGAHVIYDQPGPVPDDCLTGYGPPECNYQACCAKPKREREAEAQAEAEALGLDPQARVYEDASYPDDLSVEDDAEALAAAPVTPLYSGPHGNYTIHAAGSCDDCTPGDYTPGGGHPCPGPEYCADFDCPCG